MTNCFEELARQQMSAATKAKLEAAEKRARAKVVKSDKDAPTKPTAMEKDQLDKNAQLKLWRAYHRDEIAAVVDGPYRNEWRTLAKTVRDMAFENPAAIVDYVRNAQWLHDADARTRSVALATIARKIMQLRELEGYAPFDDSLPGEEPTAFEIVRSELNVLT